MNKIIKSIQDNLINTIAKQIVSFFLFLLLLTKNHINLVIFYKKRYIIQMYELYVLYVVYSEVENIFIVL